MGKVEPGSIVSGKVMLILRLLTLVWFSLASASTNLGTGKNSLPKDKKFVIFTFMLIDQTVGQYSVEDLEEMKSELEKEGNFLCPQLINALYEAHCEKVIEGYESTVYQPYEDYGFQPCPLIFEMLDNVPTESLMLFAFLFPGPLRDAMVSKMLAREDFDINRLLLSTSHSQVPFKMKQRLRGDLG